MANSTQSLSISEPAAVLGQAVWQAAELLGMSQKNLARVLGMSPASASRLTRGGRDLNPHTKEGELGILFVRVFRSLDALLGGNTAQCKTWLHAHNHHLCGIPSELIQTVPGLVHVLEYLDAMRGKV